MTRPTEANLLERFLGAKAASGGPLAVLDLPRGELSDAQILGARDQRIAQLDRHPLAETPEADEARLAIHAAAANLLDPRVRASLISNDAPRPNPAPPPSLAKLAAQSSETSRTFERDALITIGMHGGWSRKALQRISMLAHQHGVPSGSLAAIISRLGPPRPARRGRALAAQALPAQSGALLGDEPEQIDDLWRHAAIAGIAIFLGAVVLTALVVVVIRADGTSDAPVVSSGPSTIERSVPNASESPTFIPSQRLDLDAANVIAHEVRSAAGAAAAGQPDARARFEAATNELSATWHALRRDDVQDADAACIEFMRSSDEHCAWAINHIAAMGRRELTTAESMARSLWADGVLALAAGDPALPPEAQRALSRYSTERGGLPATLSFSSGVEWGLGTRSIALNSQSNETWRAWIAAFRAIGLEGTDRGDALAAGALAHLLRSPDTPNDAILAQLVAAVSWRDSSPARRWLMTQFDAADVTTDRLARLLASIANSSAAPGVGPGMTMPPSATIEQRAAVRELYAEAWELKRASGFSDELAAAVRQQLSTAVAAADGSGDAPARMRSLVQLVRANALATRLRAEDAESVAEEIQLDFARLDELDHPGRATPFDVNEPVAQDGVWGAATLAIDSKDSERIIQAAGELAGRPDVIGPADAGVIVRLAFRGSGVDVRSAAARALERHAQSPHALLATLDLLESIPRNESNGRVLESLTRRVIWTGSRDDFFRNARRALLERTLELIAGHTDEALIDRYATLINRYYHWASSGESIDADAPPATSSAASLRRKILSGARQPAAGLEPLPESAKLLSGTSSPRHALARTRADLLVAEQWALAAALAADLIGRRPERLARVRSLWQVLERQDARADDVLDQAIATERALAVLWQIELGEGGAP